MLVPPDNFGLVEKGVYRCTQLESKNLAFLETLCLKSIVVLDAEKPPRLLKDFLVTNKVEFYNLGGLKISNHNHTGASSSTKKDDNEEDEEVIPPKEEILMHDLEVAPITTTKSKNNKNDQWMLIEKNIILKAFEILFDKTRYNVLFVDSTSTLIGILRKIQKWNFNSIVNEYRIFSSNANKSNYFAETFLELITIELVAYEIDKLNHLQKREQSSNAATNKTQDAITSNQSYMYQTVNPAPPENSVSQDQTFPAAPLNCQDNNIPLTPTGENKESLYIEDEEMEDEDIDDDLLSVSPQIPHNLLKLVEMRNNDISNGSRASTKTRHSPGTSPGAIGSRKNSYANEMILLAARGRRRSSMDSKYGRFMNSPSNNGFLSSNGSSLLQSNALAKSVKNSSTSLQELSLKDSIRRDSMSDRFESENSNGNFKLTEDEKMELRKTFEFKFYKNLSQYPETYKGISAIKLKLPKEDKLPDWFIQNRNSWEHAYRILNRNT